MRAEALGAVPFAAALERAVAGANTVRANGRVAEVVGTLVRAVGVDVRIGEICRLLSPGQEPRSAEVVGFAQQSAMLMPFEGVSGLSGRTEVEPTGALHDVGVGRALVGRVLNGFGQPIDGLGAIAACRSVGVHAPPPDPLKRVLITRPIATGVRAIDGLLTVGEGQRLGIFAPAGAGKSTLLGMMARGANADVNVIALIGERGREVQEFIQHTLGPRGMAKSVLVVATSDRSAIERTRAAHVATAIAESFRAEGQRVMLFLDSLTRFARGQREIGLACGEPPTRRGFPPSLFAELPRLLERAGQAECGSITAFYTVLVEDEMAGDPIAEETRSILDGHIVLSEKLAAAYRFPAIDVLASVSRVMPSVVGRDHMERAGRLRQLLAKHRDIELLVQIGEYKRGADSLADDALELMPQIERFLVQATDEPSEFDVTCSQLRLLARNVTR